MSSNTLQNLQPKIRLDYVDALRGLAALMVLVCHSLQVDPALEVPSSLANNFEACKYGVQLFFVISGFTIFYSLHNSDSNTTNFFIRRFFRIAPLYFVAVIFYGWLYDISLTGIFLNLFFLHGFSPEYINRVVPGGWSIGVEMVFYCMVPFLFRKITGFGKALKFFLITLLFSFFVFYAYRKLIPSSPFLESFVYFWLPNQLPVFALGFVTFYASFGKASIKANDIFLPILCICLVALFQLITTLSIFKEHIIFAIGCTGLIWILKNGTIRGLVNKTTLFLGKVSYSLYLSQYAAIEILKRTGLFSPFDGTVGKSAIINLLTNLGLLFITTVILSFLLYNIVEAPFQNIGKRLIKRKQKVERTGLQTVLIKSNNKPVVPNSEN